MIHPSMMQSRRHVSKAPGLDAPPLRCAAFSSHRTAARQCRRSCRRRTCAAQLMQKPTADMPISAAMPDASSGTSRRAALLAAGGSCLTALCSPDQAAASRLPAALDRAWEAVGGGPADLVFPELFLGRWTATSTLVKLETPLGAVQLPPALARVVQRAREEDLNQNIQYGVRWIRNAQGQPVIDRAYNMVQLLNMYMGRSPISDEDVDWNVSNPNQLSVRLRGGTRADTRVTRRSEDQVADDRIDTSEFYQQTIFTSDTSEPRVKASQCFTKYKYKEDAASGSGGPGIVATQVVSDYLTSFDDQMAYLKSRNRPVVMYTYRMSFSREQSQNQQGAEA